MVELDGMEVFSPLYNSISVFTKTYSYLQQSRSLDVSVESLKRQWAREMLHKLNVELQLLGKVATDPSLIFVGNHISYMDIPLLLAHIEGLSFVAKDELRSWPVFGEAARRAGTVFVKRESGASRLSALTSIQREINAGKRIALFPSGTTCLSESKPWRAGAFKVAQEAGCRIQPFRISYSPLRAVAYIDRDFFPVHLLNMCRNKKITATLEFHEPVRVESPLEACHYWQKWSSQRVENEENRSM